jgi:ubiquinone/menaquinone biosynthesis C-methylase UbiE
MLVRERFFGEEATSNKGSQRFHGLAEHELVQEFDCWAADGRGEDLEANHLQIAQHTLELMQLKPHYQVLDLSCGSGWATCLLATRVPAGKAVGADISGEMIRLARKRSEGIQNAEFVQCNAEALPYSASTFDKVLCVEAFYYYPEQRRVLEEIYRVLVPNGRIFILIDFYRDNPCWRDWVEHLKVKVHLRSAAEYIALLKDCGLVHVEVQQIAERHPRSNGYLGAPRKVVQLFHCHPKMWIPNVTKQVRRSLEWRKCRRIGALLLIGSKPGSVEAKKA